MEIYQNPDCTPQERAADLLSRMTLEEKCAQLRSDMVFGDFVNKRDYAAGNVRNVAHFLHGDGPKTPRECAEAVNEDQWRCIEAGRLGIPALNHGESLHGAQWGSATCFPQSIAMAAAWDQDLTYRCAQVIAKELRAVGVRQTLAPVVNIARDPRWGRVQETYGEDPWLSGEMGTAYVRAMQENGVAATPKHFAANVGDGGRDSNAIFFSERLLREIYLPAFRRCVVEGGAQSIMTAYNSIDGMPCTCNSWLLEKILRDEWGFEGFVVTDYNGVEGIWRGHALADSLADAARRAICAGVEVDLPNGGAELLQLARSGELPLEVLDRAVLRLLRVKFSLGLFDEPYVDPKQADARVRTPEHRALALEAARESAVLLKNDGLLPLAPGSRLALFGSGCDVLNLGDYSGPYAGWKGEGGCTARQGLAAEFGAENVALYRGGEEPEAFARRFDAAVVFAQVYETEGADRSSLELPNRHIFEQEKGCNQYGLIVDEYQAPAVLDDPAGIIRRLHAAGVPVVVVLQCGSAVTMEDWIDSASAILLPWYSGEQGGRALAELLSGKQSPCGKLPLTFPRSVGQLPLYYNHYPTGRSLGYVENDGTPLFPFGYGLSYTTFAYWDLELCPEGPKRASVRLTVENRGTCDAKEVVQLYLRARGTALVQPVRALKAFRKVWVPAGGSRRVELPLGREQLSIWDERMEFTLPGEYEVMVGASSADIRLQGTLRLPAV